MSAQGSLTGWRGALFPPSFRHGKAVTMDDDAIRQLVVRLSRPHPSGGEVIERAAVLAAGADSSAVLRWITEHDGAPEELAPVTSGGGLHGSRFQGGGDPTARNPLRYVLPPGSLS
ncbi:MAG: hypothetical protein JWM71_2029 [Solirubrobacteraceae bacterium]|nr:hypothetical protein [Solirubrobacteraceae bacterium]